MSKKMTNEVQYLNVGTLKKILKDIPDEMEVYIRCCVNPCGNIVEAGIVSNTSRGFFGSSIPCIIIEPAYKEFLANPEQH